jgi:hypothetical protein
MRSPLRAAIALWVIASALTMVGRSQQDDPDSTGHVLGCRILLRSRNKRTTVLEVPGIIAAFKSEIATNAKTLTFDQKVLTLSGMVTLLLGQHSTENDFATDHHQPPGYKVQLLFAGYDLDGSSKIAKLEITYRGEVIYQKVETVNDQFSYFTAGMDQRAQTRLSNPDAHFETAPAMNDYISAFRSQQTGRLNLNQLRALAEHLKDDAAQFIQKSAGRAKKLASRLGMLI